MHNSILNSTKVITRVVLCDIVFIHSEWLPVHHRLSWLVPCGSINSVIKIKKTPLAQHGLNLRACIL